MTEVPQQNVPVASAVHAVERVSTVKAVASVAQIVPRVADDAASVAIPSEGAAHTFADYARVNRDIANVVDSIAPPATTGVADAESALLSLMPPPSVVLPLPPANQDTIAFVAQVAQAIQRQAAMSRAAMAGVAPMVVDAATAG